MTEEIDGEDGPNVEWSDQVKEQAAKDPKIAEALREMGATLRQAIAGVNSGQYKSFEDAMFALTGEYPKKVEDLDDAD